MQDHIETGDIVVAVDLVQYNSFLAIKTAILTRMQLLYTATLK